MKLRNFGALVLAVVGVVPLTAAMVAGVRRSASTALNEVQTGNQRVAERASETLRLYVRSQVELIRTLGNSLSSSMHLSPEQKKRILKNYLISFPHIRTLEVVAASGCQEVATARLDTALKSRCGERAIDEALSGKVYLSDVKLTEDFAPMMTFGVPLEMAGDTIGAAVAQVDMVAIWDTVKDIRVGQTGFARLVTADGTLIAHGDPEESRRVFLRQKDAFAAQIRGAAHAGIRYHDSQGREVIALAANVKDVDWTVIVEQPVAEAFLGATQMRHDLYIVFVVALALALAAGTFVGQPLIRWIEAMRAHVTEVGRGNMESRVRVVPRVSEMKQLAASLNQMTDELLRLQNEIKSKERLSTFARVAAGLAHDLQTPIESVRGACDLVLQRPDEEAARDLLRSAAESHLPKLHRYVRDLRRLAHDGSVPLELTSVDPRALADRVARDAATSPKWQGVDFTAEGHASRIWVDESLVVRAVSNLAGNAADACVMRRPAIGKVTIRVFDDPDGGALNIDVADTGVGMPPDRLAELMIHDFRSTKRNSGVGLGLGVARHVATSHGGVITATSKEGEGSVFRLKIPRQAMAGVSAGEAAAAGRQGGKTA